MSYELRYKLVLKDKYEEPLSNRNRRLNRARSSSDRKDIVLKVEIDKLEKNIVVDKVELYFEDKLLYEFFRNIDGNYTLTAYYVYARGKFLKEFNSLVIDSDKIKFTNFVPEYGLWDLMVALLNKNGLDVHIFDNIPFEMFMRLSSNRQFLGKITETLEPYEPVLDQYNQFVYFRNIIKEIAYSYNLDFENLRYIGPFRENPSRIYRDPEYSSYSVGVHGENTSYELIRAYKSKDRSLIKSISKWTKSVLGFEITLKEVTSGLFTIMLKDENGVETNLIDNGYGISQVLPIVTEVIRLETQSNKRTESRHNNFLLLEQPELHLHPAAQSDLADLFVGCALANIGKNRIIIETHSEHLIRKLQVLVASKDCSITKDMVRIYYVDKDEKGNSYGEEMIRHDNGKFEKPWPSGFFDKGYLLSKELARASVRN